MIKPTLPKWLNVTKASGFPTGWNALTDDLAVRMAKDFKQFRPTAVGVFVAHSRKRMVIRVFIRPRATAEVLKQVRTMVREFAVLAAETPRKIESEVHSQAMRDARDAAISAALDPVVHDAESRQRQPEADVDADADADADEFVLAARACVHTTSAKSVQVFNPRQARELLSNINLIGDSDGRTRVRQALAKVVQSGGRRQVIQPPNLESEAVRRLQHDFPNFKHVLRQAVLPHIALTLANADSRLAPLLLVGPPGVGKSMFAYALAEVLAKRDGVDAPSSVTIDVAAATNGSSITGLSSHWSNAQAGQVFNLLAMGPAGGEAAANGVVILDEVDKAMEGRYSTLAGLYTLLEENTARRFEDQSLQGLVVDASHLRWVLLANDIDGIPAPILSRTLVFTIRPPTAQELVDVTRRIARDVVERLGIAFNTRLPPEVESAASDMSPREVKIRLQACIGLAVMNGRKSILGEDWFGVGDHKPRRRMGFV